MYELADIYTSLGKVADAAPYAQKAVELDPGSAAAVYNLGMVNTQLNRINPAIDYLRRAYRLEPENPQYGYSLAFYLEQSGNTSGSIDILQRIVRQETPHADALFLLGDIYLKQGRIKESRMLYQRALNSGLFPGREAELLRNRIAALPE